MRLRPILHVLEVLRQSRVLPLGLLVSIAVVGSVVLWVNTPWGLVASHDSLFYFMAADNIAAGNGVSWVGGGGVLKPLIHFPPLYPTLLALVSALGPDLETCARVLGTLLFGLNLLGIGLIVRRSTSSAISGAAAGLLALVSPVMVQIHSNALSEPLFLTLGLGSLVILSEDLQTPSRGVFLGAALLACLAMLSRYAGVALVPAGCLAILAAGRSNRKGGLRAAIGYAAASGLPVALWLGRNLALTGSLANRTLGYHPANLDSLRRFLDVVFLWYTPRPLSHKLSGAILAFVLVSLALLAARRIRSRCAAETRGGILSLLLILFGVVYAAALAVSLSFFDASTRIDDRILSPVFVAWTGAAFIVLGGLRYDRWRRLLAIALLAVLAAGPGRWMWSQSSSMLSQLRVQGAGFTSRAWRSSETVAWLRGLPPSAVIYTNQSMAVAYLTGQGAYAVPESIDPVRAEPRASYADDMARMQERLCEPNSYLVFFYAEGTERLTADQQALTEGLQAVLLADDGAAFVHLCSVAD